MATKGTHTQSNFMRGRSETMMRSIHSWLEALIALSSCGIFVLVTTSENSLAITKIAPCKSVSQFPIATDTSFAGRKIARRTSMTLAHASWSTRRGTRTMGMEWRTWRSIHGTWNGPHRALTVMWEHSDILRLSLIKPKILQGNSRVEEAYRPRSMLSKSKSSL